MKKELIMSNNSFDSSKVLTFHYKFTFGSGEEREFITKLDKKTLNLIQTEKKSHPDWAELKKIKCPNCSLNEDEHKFCPIAVNLYELIDSFKDSMSYEEVDVLIETDVRKYMKHTSLQKGLSSLIGIYMVASGCPILEKLKPMVRFHLPFATVEETEYRVLSMYLLAQYFLYKHGSRPDWEMKNLVKIYRDIRIVNENFCKKLSEIGVEDASINALVNLDVFAGFVTFSINQDKLDNIELLFNAYLA